MIVKFIKTRDLEGDFEIQNLTIDKNYKIIGIEADFYRILDDEKNPCLFCKDCFEIIDNRKPHFWITEIDDGEEYSSLPSWNNIGFFEDYHDGVKEVVEQFWKDYKKYYKQ